MDDVDAVQAQISRNMLDSGDWVTARLDGVAYLEKSPLKYWMIAVCYKLLGVHDWVARLPVALFAVVLLCWLIARMGAWAFSAEAGIVCGPDACHLRRAVPVHAHPDSRCGSDADHRSGDVGVSASARSGRAAARLVDGVMAAAIGTGLLLKGLIAAVFPIAAALLYLDSLTKQLFSRDDLAAAASVLRVR